MKIAVCMKQVPVYSEGTIEEKTGQLIRNKMEAEVNPYDLCALEAALQIKEQIDSEVTVFTMGPKSAQRVIQESYARGADNGYLITDGAFGGADVVATAYTLMQAIQSTETYDLILCGKQTTDGDTSFVSGALGKWMDCPTILGVRNIYQVEKDQSCVEVQDEKEQIQLKIKYPCVLSIERDSYTPRMPSLKLRMQGKKKEVSIISLEHLENKQKEFYGTAGSATRVVKIFTPECKKQSDVKYMTGKEAAIFIMEAFGV